MTTLAISVPGYTDVTGHTEYIIKTVVNDQHFATQHRFSNFLELHDAMLSKLSKLPTSFPIAKSMFGGGAVKNDRVRKLEDYLKNVVQLSGERPPPALLKFLRVDAAVFAPSVGATGGADRADAPGASNEPIAPFAPFCGPNGAFVPERPNDINEGLREGIKAGDTSLCLELIKSKADPLYRDRQGARPTSRRSPLGCPRDPCSRHRLGALSGRLQPRAAEIGSG